MLELVNDKEIVFIVIGGAVAIAAILICNVRGMVVGTARERTRREIAAYIAEGSMTPEQGERILMAKSESDK